MRVVAAVVLALSVSNPALPASDPLGDPGWDHFYNLEYNEAISAFLQDVARDPHSADARNHLAQCVLYREMLRDGALESQLVSESNPFLRRARMQISAADRALFMDNVAKALSLSDAALAKNPRDTQALHAQGVAHGLRANYLFLVDKAWLDSLHEMTAARKANQEIIEIDPKFVDAHLVLGVDEYVVGCLSWTWRTLASLGGFRGDKEGGIRQLQLVASKGTEDRYDAQAILAAIYRREHRSAEAIPLLDHLAERFPRNYLFRFEQVQMYSDLGDKQSALRVLGQVEQLRASGAPGYGNLPAEKIAYLRGNLLFWYRDLAPALADMRRVTAGAAKLDLNTAVMGWLRLGQIYDLEGKHDAASEAYRQAMKTAPNSDAANEAKSYIANPYRRKPARA